MANDLYSMAFFDVQNLFRHAKAAYQVIPGDGYHHPNFDPIRLHEMVAGKLGFKKNLTRFYTGVPSATENEMWAGYWANRKRSLERNHVKVETRPLRYVNETLADGTPVRVPHEKGIDIRISLDLVACVRRKEFDIAIIFSQDQDLAEAVKEVKSIAADQRRNIKIISAFPASPTASSLRGINGADWFKIMKSDYDSCIDSYDYRDAKFR